MIYGYLRTSRAAVDGLAGMHPETQLQALANAEVELANIFQDVGISGSVLVSDRPGWTELDTKLIRGDTVTVAALDRISRNRLDLVGVVESLHRRGVGIASLAPAESWLHPLSAHPTEVEQMIGEIILRVMAWAAQAELESIKRRIAVGIRRAAEEGRFPGRPRALTPSRPPPSGCCAAAGNPSPQWHGPLASPAKPSGAPSSRSSSQGAGTLVTFR